VIDVFSSLRSGSVVWLLVQTLVNPRGTILKGISLSDSSYSPKSKPLQMADSIVVW
jgi:hypothetical protein